jgi:hypothetical protein
MNILAALLFGGIGIYSIVAAATDWEWFMTHRSASLPVWLLGRTGARLFFVLLGVTFIAFGVVVARLG